SAVEKTVLVDFHSKDYDQAVVIHEFLQQHGFTTLTGPDADGPRRNMQLFQDRLKQAGTMVIPVHNVSEEWVRERVNAALQVIALKDCPTKAILVHVVAPRLAPPSSSPRFGRVTVRWLDKNTAAATGVHALSQLLDAIEVART